MGNDLSKTDFDCSETTSTQSEPNNDFGYGMVQNVLERSSGSINAKTEKFSPGTLRRLVSTTSYIHESSVFWSDQISNILLQPYSREKRPIPTYWTSILAVK